MGEQPADGGQGPTGKLKIGSLFSGIGGFDLGFAQAGFVTSWLVDNNRFCQAVLKTHFSHVPLFSDVRDCGRHNLSSVDVICGGFPCQDLSTAGKRAGLHGEQSSLFFEAIRIARELRPSWVVLENVPGLLSSKAGRDFAIVLSSLAALGYFVAYRILDSQFFGVPQRRRRVFIIGSHRKGGAAKVLFDTQGSGRNAQASQALGQDDSGGNPQGPRTPRIIAGTLTASPNIVHQAVGNQIIRQPITAISAHSQAPDSLGMRTSAWLPPGLDGSRYRTLGNAVTVPVARWIAERIKAASLSD
jgi:DNA (cytosine-5)-methyltransferase 1